MNKNKKGERSINPPKNDDSSNKMRFFNNPLTLLHQNDLQPFPVTALNKRITFPAPILSVYYLYFPEGVWLREP